MKNSKWLAGIVVLQALILIGQWTGGRGALPQAYAGDVPDPAGRQMQLIQELKEVNSKLDKIIGLMESGDLQVKAVQPDESKGAARH